MLTKNQCRTTDFIALLFTFRMHAAHTSSREAKGAVRTSMAALLLSVKVAHMKGKDGHLAQHQCSLFRPGTVIHPGRQRLHLPQCPPPCLGFDHSL